MYTPKEEKIRVIKYIIENNITVKDAAKHFNYEYFLVYSWYKKYKEKENFDCFNDKRGRPFISDDTHDYRISLNKLSKKEKDEIMKKILNTEVTFIPSKKIKNLHIYLLIDKYKNEYTIDSLCKAFNINRNGFYIWQEKHCNKDL